VYKADIEKRLCQGDILKDFSYDLNIPTATGERKIVMNFPYVIVLTQDCDLMRDFEYRNHTEKSKPVNSLYSVLICPMFIAAKYREGTHLENLGITADRKGGENWKNIENNQNPRIHYLMENAALSIPELVIDFKYFYTFPTETMYQIKDSSFKGRVVDLYRESISQRFSNYLSRIALPDENSL